MNLNKIDFSDAVDFDIRDLSHSQDSVKIGDGTDFLGINADGSINITDNGGSLTVDAIDLDIRDLTHVSDNVRLGNGTVLNTITTTGPKNAIDVHIAGSDITFDLDDDLANTAIENTAYNATTTGGDILAGSQLASRKHMFVQNLGSQDTFVGKSGVTIANGLKLFKNNTMIARIGPAVAVHALTASGTADIRVMELS
jgi:hypothetical protein